MLHSDGYSSDTESNGSFENKEYRSRMDIRTGTGREERSAKLNRRALGFGSGDEKETEQLESEATQTKANRSILGAGLKASHLESLSDANLTLDEKLSSLKKLGESEKCEKFDVDRKDVWKKMEAFREKQFELFKRHMDLEFDLNVKTEDEQEEKMKVNSQEFAEKFQGEFAKKEEELNSLVNMVQDLAKDLQQIELRHQRHRRPRKTGDRNSVPEFDRRKKMETQDISPTTQSASDSRSREISTAVGSPSSVEYSLRAVGSEGDSQDFQGSLEAINNALGAEDAPRGSLQSLAVEVPQGGGQTERRLNDDPGNTIRAIPVGTPLPELPMGFGAGSLTHHTNSNSNSSPVGYSGLRQQRDWKG